MACLVNSAAPCRSSGSAMLESCRTSEVSLMSSTPSSTSSRSSSAQGLYLASGERENRPDTASMFPDQSSGASWSGQTVHVSLLKDELWKQFYLAGNEMILTKDGRRMFPFIRILPSGLKSPVLYSISLHVVCADNFKYKYTNSQWNTAGTTDVTHDETRMTYQHPSTPATGEQLNNKPIEFKVMKMTHYPKSRNGDVLLYTMHKYFVEIHVDETYNSPHNEAEKASYVFKFPVTTFIAVTSYLSPKIAELKVKHNPFAKGFKNKPPKYADYSYPDQMTETSLLPASAANCNPLPTIFPPPNPQGFPIRSLPPFMPPQSSPTSVNWTPVSYYPSCYPSLTTYYPDPYMPGYPLPYSVPNNEGHQTEPT